MIWYVAFSDIDFFEKSLKKSYSIENSNANRLDMPFNPLTFQFPYFSKKTSKEIMRALRV